MCAISSPLYELNTSPFASPVTHIAILVTVVDDDIIVKRYLPPGYIHHSALTLPSTVDRISVTTRTRLIIRCIAKHPTCDCDRYHIVSDIRARMVSRCRVCIQAPQHPGRSAISINPINKSHVTCKRTLAQTVRRNTRLKRSYHYLTQAPPPHDGEVTAWISAAINATNGAQYSTLFNIVILQTYPEFGANRR